MENVYTAAQMDSSSSTRIADAQAGNWVERHLPLWSLPYAQLMRLERPIGWWLLLLPCWWGLVLGQIAMGGGTPDLWLALLFLVGAVAMRGAGCVINDLADQKFDAQVARTRNRPLPSGRVSRTQAFAFLALLLLLGLVVVLQLNAFTITLAFASILIVTVYPFMKRVTYWPQLVLGLAFNWGALVGWTALWASLSAPPALLYAGGVFWTLAYDTIYAHQDKDDDALIGLKSTALKFGAHTRPWLAGFFALSVTFIGLAMWFAGAGTWAAIGLVAAAAHAARQVLQFDDKDAAKCLVQFRASRSFGLLILAGLLADTLTR